MTDEERTIYELCRFYEDGICHSPEAPKLIRDCIKEACVVFEGYTRQPEPPQNKVEAVAKRLYNRDTKVLPVEYPLEWGLLPQVSKAGYIKQAREILKLFPEYEPVELEALGDEEIHTIRYPMAQGIIGQHDMCRAISQATIQRNQAKGQLFRVKE